MREVRSGRVEVVQSGGGRSRCARSSAATGAVAAGGARRRAGARPAVRLAGRLDAPAAGHDVSAARRRTRLGAPCEGADVLVVDLTAEDVDGATLVESMASAGDLLGVQTLAFYATSTSRRARRAEEAGFDLVVPALADEPRGRAARRGRCSRAGALIALVTGGLERHRRGRRPAHRPRARREARSWSRAARTGCARSRTSSAARRSVAADLTDADAPARVAARRGGGARAPGPARQQRGRGLALELRRRRLRERATGPWS